MSKFLSHCIAGLWLAALAACTTLLNATISNDGYVVHKNLAYGHDARQTLDVYEPNALQAAAPVIVFFYGGSWQWGDKGSYKFVGQALASRGFVTVIADYRVYPHVKYPAFLDDSAEACAWVEAHITQFHGDPARLFLAGHSAGAYNAAMLGLDRHYLEAAHVPSASVRGVIGIAGPYDFLPFTDPAIKDIFSASPAALTQPIHYVRPHAPPFLLAHGGSDDTVYPRNSFHLRDALEKTGNMVEFRQYPGVAHIGIILSLAQGFRGKTPLLDDITGFVKTYGN